MAINTTPPADWYTDPADATLQRWWDGRDWTDRLRPAVPLTRARGRRAPLSPVEAPVDAPEERYPGLGEPAILPSPGLPVLTIAQRREAFEQAQSVRQPDRSVLVRNDTATVAIVLGLLAAGCFAACQNYGVSLTYAFAPSLIALTASAVAFGRARKTGAGVFRSTAALLLSVPLTAFAVWAFVGELRTFVPLAGWLMGGE